MFWVNGQPASAISLSDRSFQYGDGCFTTLLTCEGEIKNWSLHQERMESCLNLLGIKCPDWLQVHRWLQTAALPDAMAGLKLHISRGEGGRGYNPSGADIPAVTISNFVYPAHYHKWRKEGVELGVCSHKLGIMPLLAGHKHNNRLEQILLRNELEKSGYQDGVALDLNNRVVETTSANLFWVKSGTLYTPDLTHCGVAGTVRRLILERCTSSGMNAIVGEFGTEHLSEADEVFISNAILGVAPVVRIENQDYRIGPLTREFQEYINS